MSCVNSQRFREDGYAVARGLFAAEAIAEVVGEITVAFNAIAAARGVPAAQPNMASLSRTMIALFQADMSAYLAAAKLVQHGVALHRMGCDENLMSALRAIGLTLPVISTRPVMFLVSDALKVPGGYHKTPPHQDFRSIQGSLDGVVVWAPFAPVRAGAYALEVLPGSHKRGLLPSTEDVFGHRVEEDLSGEEFIPLDVELGDAVIFSTLLVHRTGETGDDQVRAAASFRYNNVLEPSFVERAYPNPYIYAPNLKLLHEDAATPEAVKRVYG